MAGQGVLHALQSLQHHFLPAKGLDEQSVERVRSRLDRGIQRAVFAQGHSSVSEEERAAVERRIMDYVRTSGSDPTGFVAALGHVERSTEDYGAVLHRLSKLPALAAKEVESVRATNSVARPLRTLHSEPQVASSIAYMPSEQRGPAHELAKLDSHGRGDLAGLRGGQHTGSEASDVELRENRGEVGPAAPQLSERDGEVRVMQQVLSLCQCIDGDYARLDDSAVRLTSAGHQLPVSQQAFILQHATVGTLWLRLTQLLGDPTLLPTGAAGAVHQAFAAAVMTDERRELLRTLAMLQALVLRPMATGGAADYLTLERLDVFLADVRRRLAVLVELARACHGLQGGQVASVLHRYAKAGGQFEAAYAARLLRHVCVPLYAHIRRWVFDGELRDTHRDFFIAAAPDGGASWQDSYALRRDDVPAFIDARLAANVLRAGKSINFLREQCGDTAWTQESAGAALQTDQEQEPLRALTEVVERACTAVDARLKELVLVKFAFMHHCDAVTKLLFFGQGDFATALLHETADVLHKRASRVTTGELEMCLKRAIEASNVRFEPADVQNRLAIGMVTGAGAASTVSDVLRLQYRLGPTLTALLPADAMARCEQVSAFLWRMKTMEFTLLRAFQELRHMEVGLRRSLRRVVPSSHEVWGLLRHAGRVRSGMYSFCQAMQAYMSFEVLVGAWATFAAAVQKADNVDEVLAAHDAYLSEIHAKALLTDDAEALRATLGDLFALARALLMPLSECRAEIVAFVQAMQQGDQRLQRDGWSFADTPDDDFAQRLRAHATAARRDVAAIDDKFGRHIRALFQMHTGRAQFELRFVMMLTNFNRYYAEGTRAAKASFAR